MHSLDVLELEFLVVVVVIGVVLSWLHFHLLGGLFLVNSSGSGQKYTVMVELRLFFSDSLLNESELV